MSDNKRVNVAQPNRKAERENAAKWLFRKLERREDILAVFDPRDFLHLMIMWD